MVSGNLGKFLLVVNTVTELYTVPDSLEYIKVTINVLNSGSDVAKLKLAISGDNTPADIDYIENGVEIPALGGVYKQADIIMSPGEILTAECDKVCTIRITGIPSFE